MKIDEEPRSLFEDGIVRLLPWDSNEHAMLPSPVKSEGYWNIALIRIELSDPPRDMRIASHNDRHRTVLVPETDHLRQQRNALSMLPIFVPESAPLRTRVSIMVSVYPKELTPIATTQPLVSFPDFEMNKKANLQIFGFSFLL